jgi:hypothetical protein
MALAVVALQSVFLVEGRRNGAYRVLSPASHQARFCYTGSRSADRGKIGVVGAVAVLDPSELAQIGLREPRLARIASIFFAVFCPMKIQSGSTFFVWSAW